MAIYSWITHKKWWFSVAMLVYQRVTFQWLFPWHPHPVFSTRPRRWTPPAPRTRRTGRCWRLRGAQRPQLVRWTGRSLQLRGPAALMWLGHGGEGGFTMMISPAKSGNFSHEHVWMCSEFTEWTEKSRFKARCGVEDRQSIGFYFELPKSKPN